MKHAVYLIIGVVILAAVVYYVVGREGGVFGVNKNGDSKQMPVEEKSVEQTLEEIASNFAQLAKDFDPVQPFAVHRIWVHDAMFYAEYKNGKGALAQLLVTREDGILNGVGYFTPSESGWVLQAGEGEIAGPEAVLYERDEKGKWIRKN
ncbi:MAG: hypothetical protein HY001_03210 [Candidatus Portnoybacteria bacterium]|nr:hypothetical protein [Candidatus Portnoybacteria bacterium]